MSSALYPTPLAVQFTAEHDDRIAAPAAARAPLYAIFLETGSNEAYSIQLVSVTDDPTAGKAWVDKMNGIYGSLQKKRHNLVQATLAWRQLNPMPPYVAPVLLEVPTPAADRPATIEEREEKHRINNENFLRNLAARDPQRQWARQEAAFSKQWLAGNLTPEEDQMSDSNDNFWSIQPVAWHTGQ